MAISNCLLSVTPENSRNFPYTKPLPKAASFRKPTRIFNISIRNTMNFT